MKTYTDSVVVGVEVGITIGVIFAALATLVF